MGEDRKVYKILVRKPKGKSLLRRLRCRWEDGLKMDLRDIGWGGVEWIHLAEDREYWWALLNTVMTPQVLAQQS
jgi:hypothetical protein